MQQQCKSGANGQDAATNKSLPNRLVRHRFLVELDHLLLLALMVHDDVVRLKKTAEILM
jgi:hypothetical protein